MSGDYHLVSYAFALYEEAKPGEPFVKIGVGVLERTSASPYVFHHPYPIVQAGSWKTQVQGDAVTFEQRLDGPRGWGYRLEKKVRLLEDRPALRIRCHLENAGAHPIETFHYDHHFFRIDDTPIGPEVELSFPFDAVAKTPFGENAHFDGRTLRIPTTLTGAIFSELAGWSDVAAHNGATFRNRRTGASVTFVGDTAPARYPVWGMANCLCPEPYVAIRLAPGQEMSWSETLTFTEGGA